MWNVEIRIKWHIDKDWAEWLGNFTFTHMADCETILTDMVLD